MRLLRRRDANETYCYVVLPARVPSPLGISAWAARLIQYLQARAQVFVPKHTEILLINNDTKRILRLSDGKYLKPQHLKVSGTHVIVNPSFLLQDVPPIAALLDQVSDEIPAVCTNPGTQDYYGIAWRNNTVSSHDVWTALHALTATTVSRKFSLSNNLIAHQIPPSSTSAYHSPTLDDIEIKMGRSYSDAPIYINAAFYELLESQQDEDHQGASTIDNTIDALLKHRNRSQIPWVFNALINEIEYRQGITEPDSLPPEIHLSLTGACNLECRFCAYTDSNAIYEFSDLTKIMRLDFLRHVQILRLSSGLGEPALNKHLPEIINYLARSFPHLGLNFFTNAVALHRPGLIDALLNQVRWINVSLNAASAESWQMQHQEDHFDRVCANLEKLKTAKRESGTLFPLVFGSMVLNGKNISDLPKMPALCRKLGIDRLTAFPYAALGYHTVAHTFGPEETLENFRAEYDAIYEETVREAGIHQVSLEIPSPSAEKTVRYGLEVRGFYDFAKIEKNEWQLSKLADAFLHSETQDNFCRFLWRMGCIGSTHKGSRARNVSNYMYPCIGPLSSAELSQMTTFNFPGENEFLNLWKNPVFKHLRSAQKQSDVCAVCDKCRCSDSRDAETFPDFERLVAKFTTEMDTLMSVNKKTSTIISFKVVESR
ncbi:radical SAM protein [Caballeronia sp. DA-9]|uniref:radical SAM protein n=1 Tax=Caballeronia sp. DA-9 TaxID=3436237 RepID=UPI003F67BD9C